MSARRTQPRWQIYMQLVTSIVLALNGVVYAFDDQLWPSRAVSTVMAVAFFVLAVAFFRRFVIGYRGDKNNPPT